MLTKLLLASGILCACYWLLRDQLNALDLATVRRAMDQVSLRQLCLAVIATAGSYGSLTVLERILFETTGTPASWRRVLLGSFISNSVSASVGLVLATAALLRLRIYSRWSMAASDVLWVSLAFSPVVIMTGLLGAGLAVTLGLQDVQRKLALAPSLLIGLALLLALPAAAFLAIEGGRNFAWRRWRFLVPTRRHRLALVAVGLSDWVCASCALFAVSGLAAVDFPFFLLQFIFGWLFGAASGLPAGTGVVDVTMVRSFGNDKNVAQLAAGLLLFRLIYFAIPAMVALALLASSELRKR